MTTNAVMTVWNVELGLAVHVKAPNNRFIVIDLGSKQDFSPLKQLNNCDVGFMVITHPHLDHISDISNIHFAKPKVLERCHEYSRNELLEDSRECDQKTFIQYCDFVERYTESVSELDNPSSGIPFGGLTAQVFRTKICDKKNKNNFSAIVILEYWGKRIVVCGDNETESFQVLMKNADFQLKVAHADILVAPHHGRESAYYEEFVKLVAPKLTIISDTAKSETSAVDKYTRASSGLKVLDCSTLSSESRKCLTTRNDGNIQICFGQNELKVSTHR